MAKLPQAAAFNSDEMSEFLSWIGQVSLFAIHSDRNHDVSGKFFGGNIEGAVQWAETFNRDGYNIYFVTGNLPDGWSSPKQNNKPNNEDIASCRMVHVDIDPPRDVDQSDTSEFKATVLYTLENLKCPPSIVIDSGGGLAAYWMLNDPCENKDSITAINLQVRDMFNADACQDVSRIMRVPGTLNHPNRLKVAKGRKPRMARIAMPFSGQLYDPEELRAFFPEAEHGRTVDVARASVALGNIELLTCDQLGLTPFDPVRRAIERPKGTDRSANALHAACECIREGYDDERIAGLLLNPANAVSGHLMDQADPIRAVRRVIGRARGEEPDSLVVPDEVREVVIAPKPALSEKSPQTSENPDWYAGLTPALRLMVDTVNTYAPSPRPELALGSAIAAFATAMGRRYQTPSGLMSNMYLVGLSPSGSGKDLPVNAPAQALIACGLDGEKMVGGDIVSARGIMSALETSPTLFIPADEVGKLIQAIQDPRGNLKDAVTVLLKMYSASQSVFKGAMYANTKDRPTMLIHRPCLGFYGVSNPTAFWDKLTHASVSDGLLPRFILLPDDKPDSPPPRRLKRCVYPDALIEAMRACMAGAEDHSTFPMGEGAETGPKPYTVEYANSAADDREYQMRLDQHEWAKSVEPEMQPFVRRAAENAQKLALVRAVSDNPKRPVMRVSDLEWGWQLSARSVAEFMDQAKGNISENDQEAKVKRVLAYIVASGAEGVTTSQIGRKFQSISGREREEITTDLEGQGLISKQKVEGAGRPVHRYRGV